MIETERLISILPFLLATLIACALTGCGKADEEIPTKTNENTGNVITFENHTDESETSKDNNSDSLDSTVNTDESDATGDLYEQFLTGKAPVYFDLLYEEDDEYSSFAELKDYFSSNTPYTCDEFIQTYMKGMNEIWESDLQLRGISYAYIDCGDDGAKELAIYFPEVPLAMGLFNDIWVLKQMGDKLQMIFYAQSGYRTYGEINEYGYYTSGGSGGAASQVELYEVIDKDGVRQLIYGCEHNQSVWSLYFPDNEQYTEVAAEQGIDEKIQVDHYYFEKMKPDEDYGAYLKNSCMWIYFETDENYVKKEGNSIYEADNPYRIFWDSTKMPLSTEAEIKSAIKNREDELGITEKVKNGKSPAWQKMPNE